MKTLISLGLLCITSFAYGEAWLSVGANHNSVLRNGTSIALNISQPITPKLSLCPSGFFDTNGGFRDRSGGLDIAYSLSPSIRLSVGASYEKYELLVANDPTETHNIHTAVSFKIW